MPGAKRPQWATTLERSKGKDLLSAVKLLTKAKVSKHAQAANEYPFDAHLLALSPLYKKSRSLYVDQGGTFQATLVSSSRSLSSPALLANHIEYTPIASELVWRATDAIESKNKDALTELKRFTPSLFHEQNHRILWKLLPRAPEEKEALRRYLNFAESLVIITDMALGDELGQTLGQLFKQIGIVYDPGTDVRKKAIKSRTYRNYLQTALHATYLHLEGFKPKFIEALIPALYAYNLDQRLLKRAQDRAANLNQKFIRQTNRVWQQKHESKVIEILSKKNKAKGAPLELSDNPMNNIEQYKWAEQWFDLLGL